jgi:hypothetical protein
VMAEPACGPHSLLNMWICIVELGMRKSVSWVMKTTFWMLIVPIKIYTQGLYHILFADCTGECIVHAILNKVFWMSY